MGLYARRNRRGKAIGRALAGAMPQAYLTVTTTRA